MAFPENLTTLRKKEGLSQERLAEVLNVTRQAISKWESGQSMPDAEKLLQLSDFFQVPVDQLLRTLQPQKQRPSTKNHTYTILTFIALAILWFTGVILLIFNLFLNRDVFQVTLWRASLVMMFGSSGIFIAMLLHHQKQKHDSENR